MSLMIALCLVLSWASTVSTLRIQLPERIQLAGTAPDSVPASSNNITAQGSTNDTVLSLTTAGVFDHGLNTSLSRLDFSTQPVFDCDEGWGRSLNRRMCSQAFASIPWMMSAEQMPVTWGPRGANRFDVGLPRRFMSSDGNCAIQPFVVPGRESALVAPADAYVATSNLIATCVGGIPSKGGQVRRFGGDNNLVVSVTEYDPHLWSDNVRCFGSIGSSGIKESCNGLADRMDASESTKRFGPQGQPHDYVTPHTLTADNRCYLKITSHPNNLQTRTASWYQLWEAAILLNAMCIRHGKKGTFKVHSDDMDFSWLEVEMGDLQASNNLTLPLTTERGKTEASA